MRGVEAIMNWQIVESVDLTANYTFTDSEQKSGAFKGKALNKMPKHMANATLNWDTTQDIKPGAGLTSAAKPPIICPAPVWLQRPVLMPRWMSAAAIAE